MSEQLQRELDTRVARLFETEDNLRKYVACELIEKSDWWVTHVHGPCRAPGMANNIRGRENSWYIDYGANTLHISRALRRIRSTICAWAAGIQASPDRNDWTKLRDRVIADVRGSVSGSSGGMYSAYGSRDELGFGAHSIDLNDFVRHLASLIQTPELSMHRADKATTKRSPTQSQGTARSPFTQPWGTVRCPQCGDPVTPERLPSHVEKRCRRRPKPQTTPTPSPIS